MPILGVAKEHLTQGAGLVITLGTIMVLSTVWVIDRIDIGAAASKDAMQLIDRRVTTLEVEQKGEAQSIDRLSISVDQGRAATNDLSTAVGKLSQAIDDIPKRR